MGWPDTWEHGTFGEDGNGLKLASIAAIIVQAETLAGTAKAGIDANDVSKFRIFRVVPNP